MEFVGFGEVWSDLSRRGIVEAPRAGSADSTVRLGLDASKCATTLVLGPGAQGADAIDVPADKVATTLETILHKLHLVPVYLLPLTRWRSVFEVVSFALAKNPHWQEIDSQATVELNTRDPLECDLRDLHTIRDIVRALLCDGEAGDNAEQQGISIVATGQLLVATVIPHQPVRVEIGSAKVAEHARDAANHFLGRQSTAS